MRAIVRTDQSIPFKDYTSLYILQVCPLRKDRQFEHPVIYMQWTQATVQTARKPFSVMDTSIPFDDRVKRKKTTLSWML